MAQQIQKLTDFFTSVSPFTAVFVLALGALGVAGLALYVVLVVLNKVGPRKGMGPRAGRRLLGSWEAPAGVLPSLKES